MDVFDEEKESMQTRLLNHCILLNSYFGWFFVFFLTVGGKKKEKQL